MKINSINQTQYLYNKVNNKQNKSNNNSTNPSFKGGIAEPVVNGLEKVYSSVVKTKPFQNFIANFSKSNKTFTHVLVAESCFLSGFYMLNTLRNKKIKKEQKPQMIINDTLTLGVSTLGAYLAEDKISNMVQRGSEKYFAKHKDFYTELGKKAQEKLASTPKGELLDKVAEVVTKTGDDLAQGADDVVKMVGSHLRGIVGKADKLKTFQITPDKLKEVQDSVKTAVTQNAGKADKAKEVVKGYVDDVYNAVAARAEADSTYKGINKLKVLVIFGIIYRYLSPVLLTPVANKISSKIFGNKQENAQKAK